MTRRALTAQELQQRFAPRDVHLISEGYSAFIDIPGDMAVSPLDRTYAPSSRCCDGGPHGYSYYGHAGDCPSCTKQLPNHVQPLPDWACTVIELPRRRKPCGRLCSMAWTLVWLTILSSLAVVGLAGVWLMVRRW